MPDSTKTKDTETADAGVKEETKDEIEEITPPDAHEMLGFLQQVWGGPGWGFVGERITFKVQVQDYQPVEVAIWHQLPCSEDDFERVYQKVHDRVSSKASERRAEIEQYKKAQRNG